MCMLLVAFVVGVSSAVQLVESGDLDARDFHFFFRRCEWPPGLLEKEVDEGLWDVTQVSPQLLLKHKVHHDTTT